MNKLILAMLATFSLSSLSGCQTHDAVSAIRAPEAQVQQFKGVTPCADCAGIEVSLQLQQGGRYTLSEKYLTNDPLKTVQQGRWTRTAEKLMLVSDQGEKRYFRPQGSGLEMMDTEGNPIESSLDYRLEAVKN